MGERCKLPQRVQARLASEWIETSACNHRRRQQEEDEEVVERRVMM